MLLGLVLLSTPLYWQAMQSLPVLDPVGAIGVGPNGWYPAAVGGAATAVGAAVLVVDERPGPPDTIVLTGAIVGVVIAILAALTVGSLTLPMAVQIGFAGAAPGFAAVSGTATDRRRVMLGVGLVVLSLVPLVGTQLLRGLSVSGLAGVASLLLVTALIVYTAVLSYPFYRLGGLIRDAGPSDG